MMFDALRPSYNAITGQLSPNTSTAEDNSYTWVDFTSNGFKLRFTGLVTNASGGTYVYASFAEFPFQYARAA
jgi:hypothetical protein